MIFRKVFHRNPPGRKTLVSKTDLFVGKNFTSKFKFFFKKFHFKIWFSMKRFASKSCLLKWARKVKNLLLSAEQIESKRFYFRCDFFIETWFFNKNWIQKLSFWKIFLPQKMIIRNVLYSKSAGTKNSLFKTWHFKIFSFQIFIVQENFCLRFWFLFFWKISFQMLIFNEKVCYKVMPFKMSTQNEKLVVVRGANRVKTLFLRRDVLIEIWFLNKKWTQNLIFSKILSPQNDFSKSISSKYARTKNSRFKNWSICRKKLHFKTRIFFQKVPFQNLIFNGKVCFKIMPFKMSTQSQKLVVFRGGNQVKTLFLRCDVLMEIRFLNKNWNRKLCFWKIIFLQNMIFRKVFYYKICRNEMFSIQNLTFWNFFLKFSLCRKKFASESDSFFSEKFHFKLWFSMKKFATKSCLLK